MRAKHVVWKSHRFILLNSIFVTNWQTCLKITGLHWGGGNYHVTWWRHTMTWRHILTWRHAGLSEGKVKQLTRACLISAVLNTRSARDGWLAPKWVLLTQMLQILNFFRSYFSIFWLAEPKCTAIWSEKVTVGLFHFESVWPNYTQVCESRLVITTSFRKVYGSILSYWDNDNTKGISLLE